MYVPDMDLISSTDATSILELFQNLKTRDVQPVLDELNEPSRIQFDQAVTTAIGMTEDDRKNAYDGLRILYQIRKSVGR
jgi:hypothetical protein